MKNTTAELLRNNIEELGLSHSAKHFFEINNMHTLQDLFKMPMDSWFSFTGFNQHLLNELMNYFEVQLLTSFVIE